MLLDHLQLTSEGFLMDPADWNEAIAQEIAQKEQIALEADHWTVVYFLREYYQLYALTPPLRIFIKKLREIQQWEDIKANSAYLYKLFPEGPLKQASKIAGLPKPVRCI